jgi:hypothetical protein
MSYWFNKKFGMSLWLIGVVLSAASVVSGLSGIVAARLIAAIGAINTMVFTHLPSNVLLALVGGASSFSNGCIRDAIIFRFFPFSRFPSCQMVVPLLACLSRVFVYLRCVAFYEVGRWVPRPRCSGGSHVCSTTLEMYFAQIYVHICTSVLFT